MEKGWKRFKRRTVTDPLTVKSNQDAVWLKKFFEPHLQQDGCLADSDSTVLGCNNAIVNEEDLIKLDQTINACMLIFWNKVIMFDSDPIASKFNKIVRILLSHGKANLSKKYNYGHTLLHGAIISSLDLGSFNRLLKAGAPLDLFNYDGRSPLNDAIILQANDFVQAILEAAQDRGQSCIVNLRTNKLTPLMTAAREKCLKSLELLLAYGADVHCICESGFDGYSVMALHLAMSSRTECSMPTPGISRSVLELIMKATDMKEVMRRCQLNEEPRLRNPVEYAIVVENHDFLELIANYRYVIDVEVCFRPKSLHYEPSDLDLFHLDYFTPLSYACYCRAKESAEILLRLGAKCNVDDERVRQPLLSLVLCIQMNPERRTPDGLLQLMINNGANVNHLSLHRGYVCNLPVLIDVLHSRKYFIKLLRYGADPSVFFVNGVSQVLVEGFCRSGRVSQPQDTTLSDSTLRVFKIFALFTTDIWGLSQTVSALLDKFIFKGYVVDRNQWMQLVSNLKTPQSLQLQCRIAIRNHLYSLHNSALEEKIRHLQILNKIKQFLVYSDITI